MDHFLNIKLKQKVQYLESKVDQQKINRPNCSEIMKRDSTGKRRYSSHGNIQLSDEDRQTHMKEISEDHQVKSRSGYSRRFIDREHRPERTLKKK